MAGGIQIHAQIREEMLRQARREPALECCGLLAGRGGIVTEIFPAQNARCSATAYEIAPQELFSLFRRMREQGLEHLGQYHSHPVTENFPSPSDIEQAGYPDLAYFIVSPREGAPNPIRAFHIHEGIVSEVEIVAIES
jgi:[CysO sulfur-carrier protein]-S-L-cysteine hydrolase